MRPFLELLKRRGREFSVEVLKGAAEGALGGGARAAVLWMYRIWMGSRGRR